MADDDLTAFVKVCREFKQPISIRGSTAYVLCRDLNSASIAKSVPPLGDLDLIVRDEQPAIAMRRVGEMLEHYRTYFPASRFIHVDVFFKYLPVREDSPLGNVEIEGLPEVTIGVSERQGDGWTAKRSSENQQVRTTVAPSVRVNAVLFRDFLFLLRLSQRHKELEKAAEEVANLLNSQRPRAVGLATRQEGGARELARIDKALVKHVMLRDLEQETKPMTKYLSMDWLSRFASHLNRLSRHIILSEESWLRTPAIAYAVNGRVMTFAKKTNLEHEEEKVRDEKLAPETESLRQRLTPSLKVALPNPDDPEYCEYRDFSKGISELVFRDPAGGPLLDFVLMEGREKYYAVHAQASKGFGALSLRTDPGFMGMLNHGSLGVVRLMGLKSR